MIEGKTPLQPDNAFHAHLDRCKRCRERPFDLCPAGAILLAQEATTQAENFARKRVVVSCPNPECDPEEGCCLCEHTGRIYEDTLDAIANEYNPAPETR